MTPEEDERIQQAICILSHSNLHILRDEEFTSQSLEEVIAKYKYEHGVEHFYFDYIESTPWLAAELKEASGSSALSQREDQILSQFAQRLKTICQFYGVSINAYTQMSDKTATDERGVKSAKAIPNKCDIAMILGIPTPEELVAVQEHVNEYWDSRKSIAFDGTKKYQPNIVYTVYKNREGEFKGCKVYMYIDYSTMRTHDMFVTWGGQVKYLKDGAGWKNPQEYLIGNNLYTDPDLDDTQREEELNKQLAKIDLPQNSKAVKRVYMYLEEEPDEHGCPRITVQNFKRKEHNDAVVEPGSDDWNIFLTEPNLQMSDRDLPRACYDGYSDKDMFEMYRENLSDAYARRRNANKNKTIALSERKVVPRKARKAKIGEKDSEDLL